MKMSPRSAFAEHPRKVHLVSFGRWNFLFFTTASAPLKTVTSKVRPRINQKVTRKVRPLKRVTSKVRPQQFYLSPNPYSLTRSQPAPLETVTSKVT